MQYYGLWDLSFKHVLWAVMPMGGDWAYTLACLLGGEMAARLTNFAAPLLIAGLLYAMARKAAGRTNSLLVVAIFLSSPLVQLVTGSLLVENIWALFLVACVAAIVRLQETGVVEWFAFPAALLFGAALSTKFGSVAYMAPVLLLLLRTMRAKRLAALGLLFAFGLPPYLAAWAKTGNPIFRFLNNIFRSPYYTTHKPVIDERYTAGLHFDSLWQITFRTANYLESQDGGFGFHLLLLLPLALLAYRRRWPFAAKAALLIGRCRIRLHLQSRELRPLSLSGLGLTADCCRGGGGAYGRCFGESRSDGVTCSGRVERLLSARLPAGITRISTLPTRSFPEIHDAISPRPHPDGCW